MILREFKDNLITNRTEIKQLSRRRSESNIFKMNAYRKDKFKHLYQSKEWSDCTFIIEDEKIPAHKLLLACSSPVFEKMFYGSMASNEVTIEDIDKEIFKKTLLYIYTSILNIESLTEAWGLVYVSRKYFLPDLEMDCADYVKNNLTLTNILMCYEYSNLYNQKNLLTKCMDDILFYIRGILIFTSYHMQGSTLKSILIGSKDDRSDVIMLAIKWALQECNLKGIEPTKENIYILFRKLGILNDLSSKEFMLCYNNTNMVKSLNADQLFMFESLKDLSKEFYSEYINLIPDPDRFALMKKSNKLDHFVYRRAYKSSVGLFISRNEQLSPNVTCTKDCLVFGAVVSAKLKPPVSHGSQYIGGATIYIYVKGDGNMSNLIYQHGTPKDTVQYNDVQKIMFPVPILFEAMKCYMIIVEYAADPNGYESVLLKYYSETMYKSSNSTVIRFSNEIDGSVLEGLCYYEI